MNWDKSRILSQPIRLFWNGWESSTYALQRCGWEISAAEDIERMRMGIAFRHKEMNIRGMSEMTDFDFFESRHRDMYQSTDTNQHAPKFNCKIAMDLIIQIHDASVGVHPFNPVDARPTYAMQNIKATHLDDLAHFKRIDGNDIFLKKASMQDILNMALEKQEPRQEQIRKQMIRREELEVMKGSQLKAHLRLVA